MGSVHRLENDRLKVLISDVGAELCSIYDRVNDREIIWQANPAYWKRHAPLLFPNVGKHYENQYLHRGTWYQTKQHGFARDMEFKCIQAGEQSVTHLLKNNEVTKRSFPFLFSLKVTHTLAKNRVIVNWQVKNEGEEEMFFTIGGHPAFRVPVLDDTRQSDYQLVFDEKKSLTYALLDADSGTVNSHETGELELHNSRCKIEKNMFDRDALIFDDGQIEWAGIAFPDGSLYVSLSSKGFTNFGIWSVPGAPFVCLEPWAGRCDNQGFCEEISKKPGIVMVGGKESFRKEFVIQVY